MQYRNLGRTGLKVSRICLGTMTFGSQVEEAEATEIVKNAMSAGVNFFDTADQYINGRSEEIVGKALKGERHSMVLATKIGAWQSGPSVNDIGASRKHIMKGVEESLRRLGTDYIDLYYVHKPDYDTPIEETLRAMDDLVHQGKVRYIACSNFRAWQLAKALSVSELHNLARFECVQPPYNLITRDAEFELLPFCESEEVGVCVYNPLAAGLLTGKHDPKKPPAEGTRFTQERLGPMYVQRYWSDINFNAIARLKQVAEEHGRNMAQFALAWVLNQQAITSAVCGISSAQQLEINTAAVEMELSQEELVACDEVWHQLRPPRFLYGR